MNKGATATVETITAEVRTLMVGSRQVTMSVYKQLDNVDVDQIEPFGRVRPVDPHHDVVYVVGREVTTGSLVKAQAHHSPGVRHAIACPDHRPQSPNSYCREYLHDKKCSKPNVAEEMERLAVIADEWSSLPLIILAGLR